MYFRNMEYETYETDAMEYETYETDDMYDYMDGEEPCKSKVWIAWLSLNFILYTSWVYSVVCEWVSVSGIGNTRPNWLNRSLKS